MASGSIAWKPIAEDEKNMVREQMNRLLETSHFKNSRRYPALFRFIVEETLEGRGEFLKERLLGIRVFDRPADYDTAADPIVRVTIAEIRKRIAQYYHEEAHESELRIELLSGHYEPEFRPRRRAVWDHSESPVNGIPSVPPSITGIVSARSETDTTATPKAVENSARQQHRTSRRTWLVIAGTVAVLSLCAVAEPLWKWTHPTAIDQFWAPLLAAHGVVTFCLPNGAGKNPGMMVSVPETSSADDTAVNTPNQKPRATTFLDHESLGENVVFSDVLASVKISNLMAGYGRGSRLRLNISTTLDDLKQGPTVLVGGMDNQWTLRAIEPLRFHFAGDNKETFWILDTKNPGKRDWSLALTTKYDTVKRDYAIIARIHDDATGEPEVIVAGIGMSGTAAAGEFLVDPSQLNELRRRVGPGFRDHDFEAVLSTDVVNGIAGSPRILTVATW